MENNDSISVSAHIFQWGFVANQLKNVCQHNYKK